MNRPLGVPVEERTTRELQRAGTASKGTALTGRALVLPALLRSLWRWLTKPNADRARALYLDRPTPTHLQARAAARKAKDSRRAQQHAQRRLGGRRPDGGTAA